MGHLGHHVVLVFCFFSVITTFLSSFEDFLQSFSPEKHIITNSDVTMSKLNLHILQSLRPRPAPGGVRAAPPAEALGAGEGPGEDLG